MLTKKAASFPALALLAVFLSQSLLHAETVDAVALFKQAADEGKTGVARKTKPVDARPANAGEIIVTIIKNDGVETRSKPAEPNDFVVRNRCPETGNEEYLVKAEKFPARYADAGKAAGEGGWKEYVPQGKDMNFYILPADTKAFEFQAPWGEAMIAKPGDALVQTPGDEKDTYRVAAASFACTYDIVSQPSPQ